MFGGGSIKIDKDLLEKVKKYAKIAGYSSPEDKLKGLGYIS
jgi:hypothetical protein